MMTDFLISSGLLPDRVLRHFIRKRLAQKLQEEREHPNPSERKRALFDELKQSKIAVHTQAANDQHYELPPEFFTSVLGTHMKYSCDYWDDGVSDISVSEKRMLDIYIERAGITDGQSILELGCGWGSLSLYIAKIFPNAKILAVSNSRPQKKFILDAAERRGIQNLRVLTEDVNRLWLNEKFDRVISIEMFEHMRNYKELLEKISGWMRPNARLFVHIFCHSQYAYPFTHSGKNDWMGKHFFTGGMMPSYDLFDAFQDDLAVEERWLIDGKHYEKTANEWLVQMERKRALVKPVMKRVYGKDARKWWNYWRVFFMAYAELFGYGEGKEWCVGHYRFKKSGS